MTDHNSRYFDLQESDGVCRAKFRENNLMGPALAQSASRDLNSILAATNAKTLEIDFDGVKAISSSMIATLMKTRERCLTKGVGLRFVEMSSAMKNIFKTMHLDGTVFEIHSKKDGQPQPDTAGEDATTDDVADAADDDETVDL